MTVALGVCVICTGLIALVAAWLWSQVKTLRAAVRRYRAEQRFDRSRLDDLESARQRALRQRARREAYQRQVEQAQSARGRAH